MSRRDLTPTLRTINPGRYRQHPLSNRLLPPFAGEDRDACSYPGCITIPNGYNPGPYCLRHTPDTEDEAAFMQRLDRDLDKSARDAAKARKQVRA